MATILELSDIIRRYPDPKKPKQVREVLNLPFLALQEGEILGILGHNGSGKSTLLRIMALLEPPDEGRLFFEGEAASCQNLSQRQRVTLLLQHPYLLSQSVHNNVAYALKVRGEYQQKLVDEALWRVGLDPAIFGQRKRHELSGGEAQRVALAARLVFTPRLLLMDEPTASVDEESAQRVAKAAKDVAGNGSAVVIVSHDRDWLMPLATRLITMHQGSMVEG